MRSKSVLIIILAFILASASFPARTRAQIRPVIIAPGFEFSLFADAGNVAEFRGTGQSGALAGPTSMAFDSRGRLFIGTFLGKILILLDSDEDGRADQVKTFASNVPVPLGLEFHPNGDLFATSNIPGGVGRVLRLRDLDGDDVADEITTLVDGLPSEGDHQTDRLKFGPDGMLYVGQGSSTDDGNAKPGRPVERPLNATVFRIDVDNPVVNIFASGLRNPFGMVFHPENGQLFTTDGGSGEVCQNTPSLPPCPEEDLSPPEEVNWVTAGAHYGFPFCEGTPTPENPNCTTTRAPVLQYPKHLTPTALAFYTGPQAGELKNYLLLTLYKNLPNAQNYGGDLRLIKVEGDAISGFQLQDTGFIAQFDPIDPFDGPVEMAIDPISGDIYVARFDPVTHRDLTEHHHIIYRIHRAGSDSLPFIAKPAPQSVTAGSGMATVNLTGRHLKPGAVALADGVEVVTRQGATRFDLVAEIPASMTASEREIVIEVRNPDSARSNQQMFTVRKSGGGDTGTPEIASLFVYKKKRDRVVNPVVAGSNAKKFRIVVAGSNIDAGAQLFVGGQSLEIISANATEIVGRLKNSIIASPGLIPVQVRNSNGNTSNTINLVVVSNQ